MQKHSVSYWSFKDKCDDRTQVEAEGGHAIPEQGGARTMEDESADNISLCQDQQDPQWS